MSQDSEENGNQLQLEDENPVTADHNIESPSSTQSIDDNMAQRMLTATSKIANELSSLNRTIENRLHYDETKEKAFERLYAELDELKKNSAFEQLRPLYIDLILLFDRIDNIRQNAKIPAGEPISDLIATLNDELLEILYRRDIELINNISSNFDASFQLAISTQPTSLDEENNQVARVIRRGFRYRDRILRPEEVIVKKFKQSEVSSSSVLTNI